jgi:hypothetical protein
MAAAIPPIVVSAHPAKLAATSPNFGEETLPLLPRLLDTVVAGVDEVVCRAQRGQ